LTEHCNCPKKCAANLALNNEMKVARACQVHFSRLFPHDAGH